MKKNVTASYGWDIYVEVWITRIGSFSLGFLIFFSFILMFQLSKTKAFGTDRLMDEWETDLANLI